MEDLATMELPVVAIADSETKTLGGKISAENVAAQLKAIRTQFLRVLNDQTEQGAMGLEEVDLALTVAGEGSIGWVTARAEGSLTLRFRRQKQ